MADEQRDLRQARIFERFWDALVSGRQPRDPDDLDPDVLDAARRVHALNRPVALDATFADRLLEEIMQTASLPATSVPFRPTVIPHRNGNGRHIPGPAWVPPIAPRTEPNRAQRVVSYAGIAALIAVIVAFMIVIQRGDQHVAVPPVQETATATASSGGDWPMFKGNPQHTSATAEDGPIGPLTPIWTFTTSVDDPLNNPVRAGDTVYVVSLGGVVYALDAATGAQRWAFFLGVENASNVYSVPAIIDDTLYIGSSTGTLFALNPADGTIRWQFAADSVLSTSPLVVDGIVYIASDAGTLYAVDATTGEQRWTATGGNFSRSSPTLADGVILLGDLDGTVYAYDQATGTERWRVATGNGVIRTIAASEGVAYVPTADGVLHGLDVQTGEERWQYDVGPDLQVLSPAVADGLVVLSVAETGVYAVDAESGALVWQSEGIDPGFCHVAIAGSVAYVAAGNGEVVGLDVASGAEVSRGTSGTIASTPAISGGILYAASDEGIVTALGTSSGSTLENGATPPVPAAEPTSVPAQPTSTPSDAPAADAPIQFVTSFDGTPGERLNAPISVRVSPNGQVWVTDPTDRFFIFDLDGALIETWGSSGTGPGQFNFYEGDLYNSDLRFLPDGSFYVVDPGNRRVQQFAADRTFMRSIGSEGSGDGQFLWPTTMAIDTDGSLFVVDALRADIQHFSADGTFLGRFDGSGSADGTLHDPGGLAFDADGRLLVGEVAANRVRIFDRDGQQVGTLGAEDPAFGGFHSPGVIQVDDAGYIYVADESPNQIQVFDPDGRFVYGWGRYGREDGQLLTASGIAFNRGRTIFVSDDLGQRVVKFAVVGPWPAAAPVGAAASSEPIEFVSAFNGSPGEQLGEVGIVRVSPDGKLWVGDILTGRFFIFDLDGNLLETWGSLGSDPGQFNFEGVELAGQDLVFRPDGSFVVLDSGNQRLQEFAADRTFVRSWGTKGTEEGQFQFPILLVVADDGSMYIVDYLRNDVQHFTADGTFIDAFDGSGGSLGPLNDPCGIAIDQQGRLLVSEEGANRVRIFDRDGNQIGLLGENGPDFGGFNFPCEIKVDESGYVYVVDQRNSQIKVFDPEGRFLYRWGAYGIADGQFLSTGGIAFDQGRAIFVSDGSGRRVQKFAVVGPWPPAAPADKAAGEPVQFVAAFTGSPGETLSDVNAISVSPSGEVWVADASNRTFIFDADGKLLDIWDVAGSVTFLPDGSFYVIDFSDQPIHHYAADRTLLSSWGERGTADGQMVFPLFMAIDTDGSVFVSDAEGGKVLHFTADGQLLDTFDGTKTGGIRLNLPSGLAFDAQGRLYVVEGDANRVRIFDRDGNQLGILGENGPPFGEFNNPIDIEIDDAGYIYVADQNHHRVVVFDPTGAFVYTWGRNGDGDGEFQYADGLALSPDQTIFVADWHGKRVQKFALVPPFPAPTGGATPTP